MLLAYKPLLHKPFLWKERKINSIIAMIVLSVIASLVVRYLPLFHSTSPHPEWNIPCGADLLVPYIRLSSVLPFLQSLSCVRVFHISLFTASFLIAIGMRYYHVPIAHRLKAWLSLYYFGLQPIILESWITSLSLLRNACWHHSRV